ncbi:hypothetical protein H072_9615 [Dactylellina haptotyla CBS 200.50]|uniref:DASH complex subunit SPC19 n=1 Tax=Dactylellina haptotyla (strain CBS 200.50) TaxID=1284197 RepID=S8A2C4_DACHA|nr:hypothetical protein H072_9615 [Dactylellina haptotyla CBS 200.50]
MNALAGCVASLTLSTETLQTTIEVLDAAVADYPRLSKVLSSHRHFELISQSDLQTAQSLLSSTIQPETERLIRETEKHIHKLELKERKLIADAELLETRIANTLKKGANTVPTAVVKPPPPPVTASNDAANAEKLKKLKAQRQRLGYTVERLELEKRQKEMQVKKSMSYSNV